MAELSAREQLMLELVNRARLDPQAEAARLGLGLNDGLTPNQINGTAKQALAPNELLRDSAAAHSQWMLATNTFSHTGVGGSDPGARMTAAGYIFTGSWTWGENIAWIGSMGQIDGNAYTIQLADNLFRSPHHRVNILDGDFRQLGTGVALGPFASGGTTYNAAMAAQNFAKSGSAVFVTGVAINDADGDNFYDIGEARAGIDVAVMIGGAAAGSSVTASAGGYAVGVAGGTADVTFSSGSLARPVTVTVAMGASNVKVDLIGDHELTSSQSAVLGTNADDLALLGVASINGTGNEADNHLSGNRGSNILSGLGGNDFLTGAGGRDVLFGGAGHDVFDFNSIGDSLAGALDRLGDFTDHVDDIDLLGIDANQHVAGNQAFILRGGHAFSGHAGELRFVISNHPGLAHDHTFVYGDTNGDKRPDFQIDLDGVHHLTKADFIL